MQRRLPQGMIIQRKSPENNGLGHMRHHRQQPSNNSGLTLNQRVQGSNPCTPTNEISHLGAIRNCSASQKMRLGSTWEARGRLFRQAHGTVARWIDAVRRVGLRQRQPVVMRDEGADCEGVVEHSTMTTVNALTRSPRHRHRSSGGIDPREPRACGP